ncbi:MAG: 50S ribosomal protein L30 [Candidatus Bostrichicola ureolyticus]|nr:MAG: 50S ribosomal protein L30 [Candidatus Bostrichicola ureolyticus]
MDKKIYIKQIKSIINKPKRQKLTIYALGLKKINHTVLHTINPQILGMIKKVKHLLYISNITKSEIK